MAATIVDYDAATYDALPAFKGDLRPLANSIERWAAYWSGRNAEACRRPESPTLLEYLGAGLAAVLRVVPFNNTDVEQTRTIGHLDPPRPPRGTVDDYYVTSRPLGTTHETRRRGAVSVSAERGAPSLDYSEVTSDEGSCPIAKGWLGRSRGSTGTSGYIWDSDFDPQRTRLRDNLPALQFTHGFASAGLAPITRGNDPFWNVRAFDTALARHNGSMLPSFICAMYQLVLDDVTDFAEPVPRPDAPARP